MADLLEATKKMMKYFKRSLKYIQLHTNSTDHHQRNTNTPHSDNHKCKSCYHKDAIKEIISDTFIPKHITTETDDVLGNTDIDSSDNPTESASDS